MAEELIRLNKYLSDAGVCSRREADAAIEKGKVLVDGIPATMGMKVTGNEEIVYCNKAVNKHEKESVILLVNKPEGIVCTSEKREKNNIVDYINYPTRVYPVGRLDKDSHGLILMTNRGDLVNDILKASTYHEKEYIVRVDKEITADFIKRMSQGVYLDELEVTTRACIVKKLSKFTFSIVLTQGLNRQIRRMCKACGYRVRDLKRIRIMNLMVDSIPEGQYREITDSEYEELLCQLKQNTNN